MIFTYEIHESRSFEMDFDIIYNKLAEFLETNNVKIISDYFLDNVAQFIAESVPTDYQEEWNESTELWVAYEWEYYISNKHEKNN